MTLIKHLRIIEEIYKPEPLDILMFGNFYKTHDKGIYKMVDYHSLVCRICQNTLNKHVNICIGFNCDDISIPINKNIVRYDIKSDSGIMKMGIVKKCNYNLDIDKKFNSLDTEDSKEKYQVKFSKDFYLKLDITYF